MLIREEDRLIAELRRHGVRYLAEGHAVAADEIAELPPLTVPELFQRLAACADARVRNAAIALLLRHPDYEAHVTAALADADETTGEQIKTLALAALYLQHLWRTKLKMVLGEQPWLLVNYWRERDLPAPWLYCGELGLRALQDYEQRRRNLPINFLDDWETQMHRLWAQEWRAQRHEAWLQEQAESKGDAS